MITVKIENAYSDGHESTHEAIVPPPTDHADLEDWWQEVVFPHTGDGHGIVASHEGSCYTATIIATDDPDLLGQSHEWID
jgi:hypothetical protein